MSPPPPSPDATGGTGGGDAGAGSEGAAGRTKRKLPRRRKAGGAARSDPTKRKARSGKGRRKKLTPGASSPLLDTLNPEQRIAASTTEGPVLVLAGAGTGKTRVITVRIAHLLASGVPPSAILAMTFTNKAAREMRERIGALVGAELAVEITAGTFHAFCARSLREHAEKLGLSRGYAICDASDQLGAIKSVLRDLRVTDTALHPSKALSKISLLKNKLITAEAALDAASDDTEDLVARTYARYDEHLRRNRALDFDDLLLFMRRLLAEHEDVRAAFQEQYRYVMVDEYQDTNGAQYEIVRHIADGHRNLCVVGDDDQSIYGWRGADVAKILSFDKDYPEAVVVRLETNYRSTDQILEAANRVIACNPNRHEKALRSAKGDGRSPTVQRLDDESEEATWVVHDMLRRLQADQLKPGDIAILFRTQQQPRPLETALREANLPYILVGGMSFFDRKEVRDVLSYVRLLHNPDDEASLLRIINRPARGVGKGSIDKVLAYATERGIGTAEAFTRAADEGLLSGPAANGWRDLAAIMERHRGKDPGTHLVQHISALLDEVSYRVEVDRTYTDDRTRNDRWNGVLEVLDLAENYVSRYAKPTLSDFLERVALAGTDDSTSEQADQRQAVTLMTLHAAKGLEFPFVYLVGAEEGLLPHLRSVEEDTVEEERRLMYVGITRAEERLVITYAGSRARWGTRYESMPSRFLFELSGETPPDTWRPATPTADQPRGRKKKAARKRTTRKKAAGN